MAGEIIVPLDGSALAENAVPAAAWLQRVYNLPVVFVHVAERHPKTDEAAAHARSVFTEYASDVARKYGLGAPGHSAEVLEDGSPASAVIDRARDASFIALATHGRGGFKAAFVGSVADKIVRGARVPVLALPGVGEPPAFQPRHLLVTLDGSKESEAALDIARDFAGRTNAQLSLARAYQVIVPVAVEFSYYGAEFAEGLEAEALAYLQSVAKEGERQLLLSGAPVDAIVEAATEQKADLVVMASQGKGLAGRIAMGSTTDRVLHALRKPILVVKS